MKASNIVVSTIAALSMASVLGIAYAQSTYSDTQTGTTNQGTTGTMNQQDATGTTTQGSTTMDSRSNMDSTSTSRSQPMYNERVARADRN
jgi:hypothetical protein